MFCCIACSSSLALKHGPLCISRRAHLSGFHTHMLLEVRVTVRAEGAWSTGHIATANGVMAYVDCVLLDGNLIRVVDYARDRPQRPSPKWYTPSSHCYSCSV